MKQQTTFATEQRLVLPGPYQTRAMNPRLHVSEAAFELRRRLQLTKQSLDCWRFVQAVASRHFPARYLKHEACMGSTDETITD